MLDVKGTLEQVHSALDATLDSLFNAAVGERKTPRRDLLDEPLVLERCAALRARAASCDKPRLDLAD